MEEHGIVKGVGMKGTSAGTDICGQGNFDDKLREIDSDLATFDNVKL